MYAQFFGLRQEPFSLAPDPRYLFMSERHREALAHLIYGLGGGGGFVLLSGEIGAGKTTVCRCFLEQIPAGCNVAYIFNPKLTAEELLKTVCDEFRIAYPHAGQGVPTVKDYIDPLNAFLLQTHAAGQNNILIIDEAQNLSAEVLEQLRLLTNLETNERKLLQIVLIGQPELRDMLRRPELEQLAQRVIARFHLQALSEAETAHYVQHRLSVAGLTAANPFDRGALRRVHRLSRGVPRRINLLCDRALLGAYASGSSRVDSRIVDKAAREVFGEARGTASAWRTRAPVLALGLVGGAALFALAGVVMKPAERPAAPAVAMAPAASAASAAPTAAAPSAPASAAAAAEPASAPAAAPAPGDTRTAFKSLIRTEQQAWRELAPAWNLTLAEGDPCDAAQRQQVQCFKGSTSLTVIRQLARPGIVTLYDNNGNAAYALLTGLTDNAATLNVGDQTQQVSLPALASMWRGDFATFWRTPPGYAGRALDAEAGSRLAPWLSARLAQWQGDAPAGKQAPLAASVAAFQLAQGLKPDGLAGPMTLMQLNRATGVDEPRLRSER
jgi:general secretion pathway protein A